MVDETLIQRARTAASTVRRVLVNRGLEPLVARDILTESDDGARKWLFVVLDHSRIGRIEQYTHPELLHQMSTALGGKRIVISNSTGLRYAVLLDGRTPLPEAVPYPGWRRGLLQLGQGVRGPVTVPYTGFASHLLVAGMTQMGKTNFLRLWLDQVLQEGAGLYLVDPKAQFNSLRRHPARLLRAPDGYDNHLTALEVLRAAVAEMHTRIEAFADTEEDGLNLDRYNALTGAALRRQFIVIDEFSGLVQAAGGPKSELGALIEQIAWHGAGLGLHLVLAGQAFDRELVGRVRDQAALRVCFRVEAPSISRMIVGRGGAEALPLPGRALSTLGVLQTYQIESFTASGETGPGLTREDRLRASRIVTEFNGRLTRYAIEQVWGVPSRQARRISEEWRSRGLARKDGTSDNAVVLAPELVAQLRSVAA